MCLPPADGSPVVVGVIGEDLSASKHLLCDESYLERGREEPSSVELGHEESKRTRHFQEIVDEMIALSRISAPSTASGLLYYARNLVSMLFLGHIGHAELAAGALAVGFANITGYSLIFGLAMGMEPVCGQAYGAQKWSLLSLTLTRSIAFLLLTSLPISFLWLNVHRILVYLGQDPSITTLAKIYLLYSLPDLVIQCILHPLRIYLRTQNVTHPIAVCSSFASLIHVLINYYLVSSLKMGIKGVAIGLVLTNFNLLLFLVCYIYWSDACKKTWSGFSLDCFREWGTLVKLAIPSCMSVCLEWWWYEFMIILCGLLKGPEDSLSAIGIVMQMTGLVYIFPSSLSYAVSTRVANELGAGRPERAGRVSRVGTACGALLGLVAMAFNVWARNWWGPMFTDRTPVLDLVAVALPIVGLCELGNCPQTAMCGALRGSAQADVGAHINLGGFYGVGLPVALFLSFSMDLGLLGLWLGLLAAEVSCAAALGAVLTRTDWVLQARRAEELTNC